MTVLCEICGRFEARYVCQKCGARVCPTCFDQSTLLCVNCLRREGLAKQESYSETGFPMGFKLILAGFILTFIGILTIISAALATGRTGDISFVILLLPIPLGIVTGPYGWLLLIVALVLTAVFMLLIIRRGKCLRLP
ncbi:hypothetical protein DRO58_04395 [Candidatus Bathyarchaeota archaeon]|nr:MAG: hypothetical protein DRO58_04395 [Candidatus Bathyarchaeota archaeon]